MEEKRSMDSGGEGKPSSSSTRGKRKRSTSPDPSHSKRAKLEVPASGMSKDSFLFEFPFVQTLFASSPFPKFSLRGMDLKMLTYLMLDVLLPRLEESTSCFGWNGLAIKFLPILDNLFPPLVALAPKQGERLPGEDDSKPEEKDTLVRCEVNTLMHKEEKKEVGLEEGEEEEKEEVTTLDSQEEYSSFSRELLHLNREDSSSFKPRERVDYKFLVQDIHGEIFTRALLDGKGEGFVWSGETGTCWQLAYYACYSIVKNLEMKKDKPLYMLNVAPLKWASGIVDAHGLVELDLVDDQWKVVSLERFGAKEQDVSLDSMIERHLRALEKLDVKKEQAFIRGKKYLVATLSLQAEESSWTRIPIDVMNFPLSTFQLFAGLLRILMGERVLKWSIESIKHLQQRSANAWHTKKEGLQILESFLECAMKANLII